MQRVLKYPATMIGSDGLPHDQHPHPRLWGTFPRVLGHYSRELGLFSLETAVHKMSGLSARNFKLEDRGEIREGAYADVVVFDAATVKDVATFEQPKALSLGIECVLVNGAIAYRSGDAIAASAADGSCAGDIESCDFHEPSPFLCRTVKIEGLDHDVHLLFPRAIKRAQAWSILSTSTHISDRIQWGGSTRPNYETLAGVLRAHMSSIPFENSIVLLGRPIRLDLDGLQQKLVRASPRRLLLRSMERCSAPSSKRWDSNRFATPLASS